MKTLVCSGCRIFRITEFQIEIANVLVKEIIRKMYLYNLYEASNPRIFSYTPGPRQAVI